MIPEENQISGRGHRIAALFVRRPVLTIEVRDFVGRITVVIQQHHVVRAIRERTGKVSYHVYQRMCSLQPGCILCNHKVLARLEGGSRRECIVDGIIQVPTGPGFGVDIDPDYIKKAKPLLG